MSVNAHVSVDPSRITDELLERIIAEATAPELSVRP